MSYSSEIHWRLAAQWAGLDFETEFLEKDGEEQSNIIATYEAYSQITAVNLQDMKRKTKQHNRRR